MSESRFIHRNEETQVFNSGHEFECVPYLGLFEQKYPLLIPCLRGNLQPCEL